MIFPHHENEIAQSQACLKDEHSFAQYWLHNGFITINDEKMSKSKGNFFTVKDILKKYPGEVVRFFILQTHYRSPLDFSEERLIEAQTSLGRLQNTREYIEELRGRDGAGESAKDLAEKAQALWQAFDEAMEDDFNTADALSAVFEMVKLANVSVTEESAKELVSRVDETLRKLLDVLGILPERKKETLDAEVEALIAERQAARKARNFARADEIRNQLTEMGILLEDTREGVKWKRA